MKNDENLDKLMTLEQTADMIGVCKDTLRRWDNKPEGKLKSVRTEGNHRRYRLSDIKKYQGLEENG